MVSDCSAMSYVRHQSNCRDYPIAETKHVIAPSARKPSQMRPLKIRPNQFAIFIRVTTIDFPAQLGTLGDQIFSNKDSDIDHDIVTGVLSHPERLISREYRRRVVSIADQAA